MIADQQNSALTAFGALITGFKLNALMVISMVVCASVQGVLLAPGSVIKYQFDALSLVETIYNPPGQYVYGELRLPEAGESMAVHIEFFDSRSSLSPFWSVSNVILSPNPGSTTTSFSDSRFSGTEWSDHEGAIRLTYESGPPVELTYLRVGVYAYDKTYGSIAIVPEPRSPTLLVTAALVRWLFVRRSR